MKKISNPGFLARRRRIGNWSTGIGFLTLLGGMVLLFLDPEKSDLAYLLAFPGLMLTVIGNSMINRWGKSTPPDLAIDDLLKGLDDRYTIVHFRLGAEHALFSPAGVITIFPKYERGQISYDGKRWRQAGVSFLMKVNGVEALGDPVWDAAGEANALEKKLTKIIPDGEIPDIHPVILFLNENTQVDAEQSPVPALRAQKFKEFIRRLPKGKTISPDQMERVIKYVTETS